MNTNNEALATAFLRQLEQNNLEGALALASDDMEYWLSAPGTMNKDQCRAFFAPVAEMIRSMRFDITGSTVQGNRVALEVAGAAELSNGRSYRNRYHFLFVCEDGRILAVREYTDSAPAMAAFFAS
jgi:ketosteroid isomerase-like protein